MPSFRDAAGREWAIRFDGLLLGSLRDEHKIDLADVTAGEYVRLENDAASLVRAVCHLCRDQLAAQRLTASQLAEQIVGQAIDDAFAAVWSAAQLFFPPRRLSELQSSFTTAKDAASNWAKVGPMVKLLDQLPADMRDTVMESVAEQMEAMSSGSPNSAPLTAVSGRAASQSSAAIDSPANAACCPTA